jgi:hypothetical protein
MLLLIFALAILLISTATAAPVVLSTSEPTKVTFMMTSFITSTLTPLQLATTWPVQARQWSKPAAPVWTEPAAPVWSESAIWTELTTWATVPTVTSYSWTDAVSYSYTDVPSSATATSSASYSYEETHRPAVSGPSNVKSIIIGVVVTVGFLLAIFAYTMVRRHIYRRQRKNNRDSDIEMATSLPRNTPPPARSTRAPQAPAARVPVVHSFVKDGFHATPVHGHYFVQIMPSRKPVPAHGSSLPPHLQPTHWPTDEIHNVTWTRGRGYTQMV